MNKKKKTTRVKHRKNKDRMKRLIHASLLKAKPEKIKTSTKIDKKIDSENQIKEKVVTKDSSTKKTTAKKTTAKKTTAKKTTAKKTTAKKTTAKKTTAKKTKAKK